MLLRLYRILLPISFHFYIYWVCHTYTFYGTLERSYLTHKVSIWQIHGFLRCHILFGKNYKNYFIFDILVTIDIKSIFMSYYSSTFLDSIEYMFYNICTNSYFKLFLSQYGATYIIFWFICYSEYIRFYSNDMYYSCK